jgi:predicted nucleic acid-binding protein
MSTFLLDTSVIIDVLNGKKGRLELLSKLLLEGHGLASCAINVSEIYTGLRPKEEAATRAFLESLDYLEIPFEVARTAGLIKRDWSKKGHTLTLTDTLLAALAIFHNCTLITDNKKHFPMPQLNPISLIFLNNTLTFNAFEKSP